MPLNPFGEKAELEIGTDNSTYRSGDTVITNVAMRGSDEVKIQEARAELVLVNRYRVREERRERDSDGDWERRTVTTWHTDEAIVQREQLLGMTTLTAESQSEHTVQLRLPTPAAASGKGEICETTWKVRIVLNIRWAKDTEAECPLIVFAAETDFADRAVASSYVDSADCGMDFAGVSRSVRAGDPVQGTVTIHPRTAFEGQEIRIELVRQEETFRGEGLRDEQVVASQVVAGADQYAPGQDRPFPFELTVPGDAYPCLRTEQAQVRWFLRAVVNRRLRSDYNGLLELNVYNG